MEQVFDLSKKSISDQSNQELNGRLALLADDKVETMKHLNFLKSEIKLINEEIKRRKEEAVVDAKLT